MKTKFIEVDNGFNWGKFAVCEFDQEEWERQSHILPELVEMATYPPLLFEVGWRPHSGFYWVLDLQTGEGAHFQKGGYATADLNKHKVWVCPMFEPFLNWFYTQEFTELDELPDLVQLTEAQAPSSMYGYRRGAET